MTDDKPLHVRVAEALGCKASGMWFCWCTNRPHERDYHRPDDIGPELMRYDTDWSATGPLIERLQVRLAPDDCYEPDWLACVLPDEPGSAYEGSGPTPLMAVCHLILALADAGKLPR